MEKIELVGFARQVHDVSLRLACRAFDISRTVYNYEPDATRDEPVIEALQKLVTKYPRYGFGKLLPILRRHDNRWSPKEEKKIDELPSMNPWMSKALRVNMDAANPFITGPEEECGRVSDWGFSKIRGSVN